MIINQLKDIKNALGYASLKEINMYLNDFKTDLLRYKDEVAEEYDEVKEVELLKLYNIIKNIDIFDLKYSDVKTYIDKLIVICEFIEL